MGCNIKKKHKKVAIGEGGAEEWGVRDEEERGRGLVAHGHGEGHPIDPKHPKHLQQ